uniref:DUF4198 domain-containing protein n=1 Tax=Magnetococcus massalia (strain MO-1) TaxID=451514 RepID=A0A1S7LBW8_MAGMO|nr:Conserved exported protein of unknown function [Candidatus Magnetococcus massalia]
MGFFNVMFKPLILKSVGISCVRSVLAAAALLPLLLLAAQSAWSHDFWIMPRPGLGQSGDKIELYLRVGEHFNGESVPNIPEWYQAFLHWRPQQAKPVKVVGELGDDPAGSLQPAQSGIHFITYRSQPESTTLKPAKFNAYLRKNGLESILALRKARGESDDAGDELYIRCAKAMIAVGALSAQDDQRATRRLGLDLELIPQVNPFYLNEGGELPVRLLYQGEPLQGVRMVAQRRGYPAAALEGRTDAEGEVRFQLPGAGEWLVTAVHMIALSDAATGSQAGDVAFDEEGEASAEWVVSADWQSYWASLTFTLAGE